MERYQEYWLVLRNRDQYGTDLVCATNVTCTHPKTDGVSPKSIGANWFALSTDINGCHFHLVFTVEGDYVAYHPQGTSYGGPAYADDFSRLVSKISPWLSTHSGTLNSDVKAGDMVQILKGDLLINRRDVTPVDLALMARELVVLFGITEPAFFHPRSSITEYARDGWDDVWRLVDDYLYDEFFRVMDPTMKMMAKANTTTAMK